MAPVGFSLPSTSMQIEPRTIVVSLLVGTLVTVVAALVPARRATKVLPVEALREATPGSGNPTEEAHLSGAVVTRWSASPDCSPDACSATPSMKLFGLGLLAHHRRRPHAAARCRPSARVADRRRRCGCVECPASWPGRTRCATRAVPRPRPPL